MRLPLAVLLIAAATTTSTSAQPRPRPHPEAVYAVAARPSGLSVVVSSNGCTRKADFRVAHPRRGAVAFIRVRPDHCRSFAAGSTRLTYGWRELGAGRAAEVAVLNPLVADPTPSPISP